MQAHLDEAKQSKADLTEAETKEAERQARNAELDAELEDANRIQDPIVRPNPQPHGSQPAHGQPNIVGGEAASGFGSFGEFLFGVRRAAFSDADNAGLQQKLQAAVSGAGTTVDSEMGFLIPTEFSSRILEHMHNTGVIFSLPYMQVPLGGNQLEIPYINETSRADGSRFGAVQGYWVGEAEAPTATNPTVGTTTLKLHKAGCTGYITEELLADAPAAGAVMERIFGEELLFKVEDAIVRGDGAKKPMGLKNAPCKIEITKETNQVADTLWGPNIIKMWARRNPGAGRNAVWLVNQDVETYLWSLTLEGRWGSASTSAEGIPLYHPAGSLTNQGEFGVLMGRPVIPNEYCDTIGTAGDVILFDPTQYIVATKRGGISPRIESSIHVRFRQDERTYRAFLRIDGQPWWSAAMTPYKGTNTLSPVITLGSRD